jgi:hypothetical protein
VQFPLTLRSSRQFIARAAILFCALVLVCVPALTRMGQRLETASHAPSFAKNVDCPPKKVVVVEPVGAIGASSLARKALELVPPVRVAAALSDETLPSSPHTTAPVPLRAPPSAVLV